ncbi:MAG: hypothetical protein QG673_1157 [Pseudomonadota bacterium]|nr:hypothetical protein [Pseudomonadota bacterium]
MLKTTDGKLLNLEELAWEDAAQLLNEISPGLVKAITDIPESQRYPFYKASYHYGDQIIDQKGIHLPLSSGGTILGKDKRLPETLQENLGCTPGVSCPIGIVLNKKCEFYVQNGEKITPYTVLNPGEIFGLSRNMYENDNPITSFWDLVAGGRSIFMLSKVSNNPQHTNLKRKYDLISRVPTNYSEQWGVFRELALKSDSNWRAEILFLDNRWVTALKNSAYAALRAELLAALNANIWHHQPSWNMVFSKIDAAKNLSMYPTDILDTARHLFNIVAGLFPGFVPAIDEMAAPIKLFQEVYTSIYELEHAPIIVEPLLMSPANKLPVYYSLNWSTAPKAIPKNMDNKKSVVFNLSILMEVIKNYQKSILSESAFANSLEFRVSSLSKAASNATFLFYDNEYEKYNNIRNIATLPDEDSRFACGDKTFPIHSAFLKGLVKISPANT